MSDSDFQTDTGGQEQEERTTIYFIAVASKFPQVLVKFVSVTRNGYPHILALISLIFLYCHMQ